MKRIVLVLALAAVAAIYLEGLGASLGNSDEVLYAEFIRSMHRTGDYVSLRYHGALHMQRPPWPFSLYALGAHLVPGEAGLRLVPALCTVATALLLSMLLWKRGAHVAFTALLLFAGIPTVYCYGRALLSDPPFVLAMTSALFATMAAWRNPRFIAWAFAALGAAAAAKSLAAAIPALGLLPWLVIAIRGHRRSARLVLGDLIPGVVLAAPFYVFSLVRYGRHFIDVHFGINLLDRTSGKLEGLGMGGPFSYFHHLWNFDGPIYCLLLLLAVLLAIAVGIASRDPELGIPASMALSTLIGLSAVGTRLPHYLLVFYPAAVVCSALLVARAFKKLRFLAPAVALTLLSMTLAEPSMDGFLMPSHEAKVLGERAQALPEGPAYSIDWYAPAFAYYADRPWKLLTTDERMARIVGAVDTFADAKTVERVPPWPPGSWFAAGPKDRLFAAPGLRIQRIVAEEGEMVLVEATGPPQGAPIGRPAFGGRF